MENCTELIHESDELKHHGTKGQRWGIRRFQNKDGSLTPAGRKRYGQDGDGDSKTETTEETRARILKSTNAKEIYENRHLLTTNELNERITRIDTEARLASKIVEEPKKSGMDYVDKALKVGRKINEVYEFTNTPVMKAVKKQLGLEEAEKRLGLDEVYKMRDKLSDKQLADALKRASTEKAIKKILDENAEAVNKAKEKTKTDKDDNAKDKTESKETKDTKPDDTPKSETTSTKANSKPDDTPKTHVVDESELKRREQGETEWKSVSESSTKTRATGEDYINKLAGVGQTFRDNDKYAADKAREDYHNKLTSMGTIMTDHDTSAGEQYLKKMYYARGTFVDEEHMKHSEEDMDNELKHYGVVGMKWGVRKARRKNIKDTYREKGYYPHRFSTGKNYDKVRSQLISEKRDLNAKYKPKYEELANWVASVSGTKENIAKTRAWNRKLNDNYYKEAVALVDKYKDSFNEATLKDIGYKDVQKGMDYLKKHDIVLFDMDL